MAAQHRGVSGSADEPATESDVSCAPRIKNEQTGSTHGPHGSRTSGATTYQGHQDPQHAASEGQGTEALVSGRDEAGAAAERNHQGKPAAQQQQQPDMPQPQRTPGEGSAVALLLHACCALAHFTPP
jgi:hypothetical protein